MDLLDRRLRSWETAVRRLSYGQTMDLLDRMLAWEQDELSKVMVAEKRAGILARLLPCLGHSAKRLRAYETLRSSEPVPTSSLAKLQHDLQVLTWFQPNNPSASYKLDLATP